MTGTVPSPGRSAAGTHRSCWKGWRAIEDSQPLRQASHSRPGERGFTLAEWAVTLAIMGILAATLASLIGWATLVQGREASVNRSSESVHQAGDVVVRLLRGAGAAGRPALAAGTKASVTLCGVRWGSKVVRGTLQLDAQGRLVLYPSSSVPTCAGSDVTQPIPLAPDVQFEDLTFEYHSPSGTGDGCGGRGQPPCNAVTALTISMIPAASGPSGAALEAKRVVTLRNPGRP